MVVGCVSCFVVKLERKNWRGESLLQVAVINNDVAAVKRLIKKVTCLFSIFFNPDFFFFFFFFVRANRWI